MSAIFANSQLSAGFPQFSANFTFFLHNLSISSLSLHHLKWTMQWVPALLRVHNGTQVLFLPFCYQNLVNFAIFGKLVSFWQFLQENDFVQKMQKCRKCKRKNNVVKQKKFPSSGLFENVNVPSSRKATPLISIFLALQFYRNFHTFFCIFSAVFWSCHIDPPLLCS